MFAFPGMMSALLQKRTFDLNSIKLSDSILNHGEPRSELAALDCTISREKRTMTWRVDAIDFAGLTWIVALGVVLLTCGPLP